MDIVYNNGKNRYELTENGHTAFAEIRRIENKLYIDYVESPLPLRGKGSAGRLMQGIVNDAQSQGLEIHPICGYARQWLRRKQQEQSGD